jgi:hypothetical protein
VPYPPQDRCAKRTEWCISCIMAHNQLKYSWQSLTIIPPLRAIRPRIACSPHAPAGEKSLTPQGTLAPRHTGLSVRCHAVIQCQSQKSFKPAYPQGRTLRNCFACDTPGARTHNVRWLLSHVEMHHNVRSVPYPPQDRCAKRTEWCISCIMAHNQLKYSWQSLTKWLWYRLPLEVDFLGALIDNSRWLW